MRNILNNMAELAQPLYINTVHNVYDAEELIQLTIESNAKIIVKRHKTKDLK